jgi:putative transposase
MLFAAPVIVGAQRAAPRAASQQAGGRRAVTSSVMKTFGHRRSIRMPAYDYTSPGSYFLTICTQDRRPLFEDRHLAALVEDVWRSLPRHHPEASLDVFVVMPNHVHGILGLHLEAPRAQHAAPLLRAGFSMWPVRPQSLGAIVRAFKSACTKAINDSRGTRGAAVWQRNYFERLIRDDEELARTREYVASNPAMWSRDPMNPRRVSDAEYAKVWSWLEGSGPTS